MPKDTPVMQISLATAETTRRFGGLLGAICRAGDVLCLYGELGAGKTTLTQGLAVGLQVPENMYVTSPSFALMHEYPGRLMLYHMDLYRLAESGDVEDLGFDEYFYGDGVTVIEWPDRAQSLLPAQRLHITLRHGANACRQALLTPHGASWRERLRDLAARLPAEMNE